MTLGTPSPEGDLSVFLLPQRVGAVRFYFWRPLLGRASLIDLFGKWVLLARAENSGEQER